MGVLKKQSTPFMLEPPFEGPTEKCPFEELCWESPTKAGALEVVEGLSGEA